MIRKTGINRIENLYAITTDIVMITCMLLFNTVDVGPY